MSAKLSNKSVAGRVQPLFFATLLISSFSAFGDNCSVSGSCKIQVDFIGTYLAQTCDVSVNNGSSSGIVTLPTISAQLLQKSGAEAGSTQFPVSLKNCPVNRTVEMRFTTGGGNVSDAVTGNLVNSTGSIYSNDVQLRVRNIAGTQIRIDDINSYQEYLIPASGDEVTHYFIASYYAKRDGTVNAGRVQTRSTIDLTYK